MTILYLHMFVYKLDFPTQSKNTDQLPLNVLFSMGHFNFDNCTISCHKNQFSN